MSKIEPRNTSTVYTTVEKGIAHPPPRYRNGLPDLLGRLVHISRLFAIDGGGGGEGMAWLSIAKPLKAGDKEN